MGGDASAIEQILELNIFQGGKTKILAQKNVKKVSTSKLAIFLTKH